jgi:signal transduction histidine kinase
MDLLTWQRKALLASAAVLALLVIVGTLISSFQWIHRPFPGFFLYGNLSVAPDFLPQWSGRKAGLAPLDRIVAVQGEPIKGSRNLYALVHRHPAGFEFDYTVERAGKIFQLRIPSMKFSFQDWLLSFGVYLLAGIGFLIIGGTPFYLRSPSPAAQPLFFMVSAIFLWFTGTFDFMTSQFLPKQLRILAFTLTPSSGIHLGLLLTRRRRGLLPYLILVYGISILIGLFYSFSFHSSPEVWHWALRLGYGYGCLGALIFLALLWFQLRRPISDLERSRLRVILVGAILGFFLPTFGTVLTSFLSWEIPYNLLLIPTVFFPLSVAYALLKYNLFDLGRVLKVALTRGALTGALLLIYVLVVPLLGVLTGIYEQDPLVPLFFSILVVLLFNSLLRWIEGTVERYLYGREYDPMQLQREASSVLRTLSRPQPVAEKYLRLIGAHVGIKTAHLLCRTQEQEECLVVSLNGGISEAGELSATLHAFWVSHLGTRKRELSRDEADTDPLYEANRAELVRIFDELKSELLIPLIFEDDILGFLFIGKRHLARGYSAEDYELLCNLADQLALAIKNGMLFEKSEKSKESYQILYNESQALNERLIEVDRLKKHFIANISHELRTPVSTILGYTEMLLDPSFAGDKRPILERLLSNGQDLSRLMDHLLDFSRLEAGTTAAGLQEVNIREVLQSLEIMTQRLIRERPIRFRTNIESLLDAVKTDAKKLQQILVHLLMNALKFTERGEIVLNVRRRLEKAGLCVEFSVSDTGIGISKQDQEIIFEDFRQLDGSSTRQYGGTGLGLSLCKKLAQSLNGKIEVQSVIGQGSTFSLILPLQGALPVEFTVIQVV